MSCPHYDSRGNWIPAFAGMTAGGKSLSISLAQRVISFPFGKGDIGGFFGYCPALRMMERLLRLFC